MEERPARRGLDARSCFAPDSLRRGMWIAHHARGRTPLQVSAQGATWIRRGTANSLSSLSQAQVAGGARSSRKRNERWPAAPAHDCLEALRAYAEHVDLHDVLEVRSRRLQCRLQLFQDAFSLLFERRNEIYRRYFSSNPPGPHFLLCAGMDGPV